MIRHEWRRGFTSEEEAELRAMLADAAEYDAEPGFSRLDLDDPVPDGTRHLLVWLLPDGRYGDVQAPSLAAYLRVEPDGAGGADAAYLVRPEYRSRGITTMLLERTGLDLGHDPVRIWARGNHPAALRAATRFGRYGIAVTRTRWRLLAPLRPAMAAAGNGDARIRAPATAEERSAAARLWPAGGDPPSAAEPLVIGGGDRLGGVVWVEPDAGEKSEYGTAGRISAVAAWDPADAGTFRALLVAAMRRLQATGLRVAAITVDERERTLVHEARLLGFTHDRTDVQYTVGTAGRTGRSVRCGTADVGAVGR